jgi:hypothetical protein
MEWKWFILLWFHAFVTRGNNTFQEDGEGIVKVKFEMTDTNGYVLHQFTCILQNGKDTKRMLKFSCSFDAYKHNINNNDCTIRIKSDEDIVSLHTCRYNWTNICILQQNEFNLIIKKGVHIPLKSCLSKHENKADDIKLLLKFKRSTSRRLVIAQRQIDDSKRSTTLYLLKSGQNTFSGNILVKAFKREKRDADQVIH